MILPTEELKWNVTFNQKFKGVDSKIIEPTPL